MKRYPTKSVLIERMKPNAVEVFRQDAQSARDARTHGGSATLTGWYFWTCMPGCLPDSDAFGPYGSPLGALRAAYDADFLPDNEEQE